MTELLHENEMLKEDIERLLSIINNLSKQNDDLRFQLGVFNISKPDLKSVRLDE